MNELVSIIVPVFNVYEYLENCLKSLLMQTYKNIEIILIDDGSFDGSEKICDKYGKMDKRVSVIHNKNMGVAEARNIGIENSTGEYILFVDSDDYIHVKTVELLLNEIKINNADIVWCNYKDVTKNDYNMYEEELDKLEKKSYTGKEIIKEIYGKKRIGFIVVWGKLYKRRVLGDYRFINNRIHEDEFFTYKLLYESNIVVYIENELYYYMNREGSITKNITLKNYEDIGAALEERINFFMKNGEIELLTETKYMILNNTISKYYLVDHKRKKVLYKKYREMYMEIKGEIKKYYFLRKFRLRLFFISPTLYKIIK